MDLTQSKLSRKEWETIEIKVSESELTILKMMVKGYNDVAIRHNNYHSLYTFIKVEQSPEIEYFLYKKYFEPIVLKLIESCRKRDITLQPPVHVFAGSELKTMKSADSIRLQNLDDNIKINRSSIFEFLLIDLSIELLKHIVKNDKKYAFYLYTLLQLKKSQILYQNRYVLEFVDQAVAYANGITRASEIISNAYEFIEKNPYLFKYEDISLFSHQKELFTVCKIPRPKLILYTAPTGTGKTLSPIGLSEGSRIIFVCVARHIGLALAKCAISVEKKIAFAFGCETASDIRLHYFSALSYTKNRKSGGIGKVDNSVGDNVEIMICDVKSYLPAMRYMLAFNSAESIITYWDEPTITMDYEDHPLHETIHKNWTENQIPTVVLSCATLPNQDEIQEVFGDFRCKFDGAEIHTITSFDCKKSIPILNKEGFCVLPHYMHASYDALQECAHYCSQNKTLLRYFDLREIVRFIQYVNDNGFVARDYSIDNYFAEHISDITMNSLKEYYLHVLLHVENWPIVYEHMLANRTIKYPVTRQFGKVKSVESGTTACLSGEPLSRSKSVVVEPTLVVPPSHGIMITTSDAYTLTDGPTIFLAENVGKIGTFYTQQSKIPTEVFQTILAKIVKNNEVMRKIDALEGQIVIKEGLDGDGEEGSKKAKASGRLSKESQGWMGEINKLRKEIRMVSLEPMYLPNSRPHQLLWTPEGKLFENAFVSNIGEDMAKTIMLLDIENHLKVLLLLGIGLFMENANVQYMEIMKQLADEQRLFIIIASTDYVYGTNYQFCHGFIGKDLANMTQQKTLQAMGRIGRNNIQQDYTVRFRDDEMIERLFSRPAVNREAENMCRLFSSN
jgi:hypothetical protein